MRVAVIGSRALSLPDLAPYLPPDTTEIVTGGAQGVDRDAMAYAEAHAIPCRVILPDYERYGKGAPLRRNDEIIASADMVLAFWDGASRGTAYVIGRCGEKGVPCRVVR